MGVDQGLPPRGDKVAVAPRGDKAVAFGGGGGAGPIMRRGAEEE